MKDDEESPLDSSWNPSKSFMRTSWGILHPHPLNSAKLVRRKPGSRSCSSGSKGRQTFRLPDPATSNSTADKAACCWFSMTKRMSSTRCLDWISRLDFLTRCQDLSSLLSWNRRTSTNQQGITFDASVILSATNSTRHQMPSISGQNYPIDRISERERDEREARGKKARTEKGGEEEVREGRGGKKGYSVSIQLPWKVSHAGNPPFGIHSSPTLFTRTIGSTVGEYIWPDSSDLIPLGYRKG